ncbi:MAG: M48 family metalloprotease [Gemmatimonadetes bacterium]|nr:M48 family metalloprotease [Gemmatimonadota bacterium]
MTRPFVRLRRGMATAAVALGVTMGAGCAISTQQEAQLGAQSAAEVNQQLPIVRDAALNRYITALGNEIAAVGPRRLDWHFYIVNSDVVNAMSLPGGYVYVNRGVIENAANMSELAGVLAHEIGHVEERHSVQQVQRVNNANLGLTLAYVLMGRQPSAAEQAAITLGGNAIFAKYGRDAEREADADAVALTTRAGISPRGLPTFFEKLVRMRRSRPSVVEGWFATHPTEEERIQATSALVNQIPRGTLSRLQVDSNAFRAFKARLARYPQPPAQYRSR